MKLPKDHLHTLVRNSRNKKVFRCAHPDCTFFAPVDRLRGKRVSCKCGNEIILEENITDRHFKRKEIKCDICLGKKASKIDNAINRILDISFVPQVEVIPVTEEPMELEIEEKEV